MKGLTTDFLKFAKRVSDGTQQRGSSLIIKRRDGIVSEFYNNPEYVNKSGAGNSGVVFHYTPEWHKANQQDYDKWVAYLRDDDSVRKLFSVLAEQRGIFVSLIGTTVRAHRSDDTLGRTIYSI